MFSTCSLANHPDPSFPCLWSPPQTSCNKSCSIPECFSSHPIMCPTSLGSSDCQVLLDPWCWASPQPVGLRVPWGSPARAGWGLVSPTGHWGPPACPSALCFSVCVGTGQWLLGQGWEQPGQGAVGAPPPATACLCPCLCADCLPRTII